MHVLGHNSSILACMQLYPRKGRSLIVEHSFGAMIVHIRHILFELCLMEKKKEVMEKKKEEEEQQQQNQNFRIQFSRL